MVQAELGCAPMVGVMVGVRLGRGLGVKVLFWDGSDNIMIYKRLEQVPSEPAEFQTDFSRTRSPKPNNCRV